MKQFDVEPVSLLQRSVYGCSMVSSERTVSEDIPVLAKRYRAARPNASWPVLPFFVLSRGFNRATGRFSLFVGGEEQAEGLELAELPAGLYARIIVKPRFAFLLGREIGRALSSMASEQRLYGPKPGIRIPYGKEHGAAPASGTDLWDPAAVNTAASPASLG